MVRSFILNDDQRQAIEDYIKHRPNIMTSQIRQIRLRVKKLDYERMLSDVALLRRLRDLKIPKGRKAKDVAAGFTVRPKKTSDVAAEFEVQTKEEGDVSGGFDIPEKVEPEALEEKT